eukprot:TRINITY_DN3809_c0_g2_i1.p1 TRINITY_DN3809_c0_g2~~TRINITY_DN3809_c0_g2_i1.p1  ORF type:complete len:499 (-),score=65.08 TRINITY_DN3809_c0_g2_i1:33-1493(-)
MKPTTFILAAFAGECARAPYQLRRAHSPEPFQTVHGHGVYFFNASVEQNSSASLRASVHALLRSATFRGDDVVYPKLEILPMEMPWDVGSKPLSSCQSDASGRASKNQATSNLRKAVDRFCAADLRDQVEFFVDPRFQRTHDDSTDANGWVPQAFVTLIGTDGLQGEYRTRLSAQVDLLVQSVHRFSKRPIIVANFGKELPAEWTPERFPRMILMHARGIRSHSNQNSFYFNKLRAMLFTKVSVGLVLDADQWINDGADYMFRRAAEEGGSKYPYPILPVHWLSRDPEGDDGYDYKFKWAQRTTELGAPNRTMRWGHAHPSWTHDALDFLAKWVVFALSDQSDSKAHGGTANCSGVCDPRARAPDWLRYHMSSGPLMDEDLLNVALWAENRTKMWCKFDIAGTQDFDKYWSQQKNDKLFADSKWFPKGIALMFFTAHDAKDPNTSFGWLKKLWSGTDNRPAILFDGHWFRTGGDLQAYDPKLKCIA